LVQRDEQSASVESHEMEKTSHIQTKVGIVVESEEEMLASSHQRRMAFKSMGH
jgi:hypothetical protein